jgi:hypothetical protein
MSPGDLNTNRCDQKIAIDMLMLNKVLIVNYRLTHSNSLPMHVHTLHPHAA